MNEFMKVLGFLRIEYSLCTYNSTYDSNRK